MEEPDLDIHPYHSIKGCHICGNLPHSRDSFIAPLLATTYQPITHHSPIYKEKLLQLATFKTTYQDAQMPISPDMVPLIMIQGPASPLYHTSRILHPTSNQSNQ